MATKIFVNLPVEDLERSKAFYGGLGFAFAEQFTDEKAACVVISEDIYAMLQTKDHFASFTHKEIVDATSSAEALFALGVESRERVDELARAALASGGSVAGDGVDLGFLYRQGFQDPDGHHWEALHMDLAAAPARPGQADATA